MGACSTKNVAVSFRGKSATDIQQGVVEVSGGLTAFLGLLAEAFLTGCSGASESSNGSSYSAAAAAEQGR